MCGGGWAERDLVRQCRGSAGLPRRRHGSHSLLQLLEGAHLDLADALARNAELVRQLLKRHRLVRQSARLQNATFALVQYGQRVAQRLAAVVWVSPRPPPPVSWLARSYPRAP